VITITIMARANAVSWLWLCAV